MRKQVRNYVATVSQNLDQLFSNSFERTSETYCGRSVISDTRRDCHKVGPIDHFNCTETL